MDPIVNRWSSCQADHYSSSESSEDEFSDEELHEEEEEEAEDFLCVDEVSDDSEQETTRVSKNTALAHLKRNGGDIERTVTEMLSEISHDSLNHLSSQGEIVKQKKVRNLTRKLERLRLLFNKKNTKARAKEGLEVFLSESQESFVDIVNVEKAAKEQLKDNVDFEMDDDKEKGIGKQFRKPFNKLKPDSKRSRIDEIMKLVEDHASQQHLTPTEMLAYLLYRVTYSKNKLLSLKMLNISKGESEKEVETVPMSKSIAIVSRGKFGRTMYKCARRMLKPHKGSGCNTLFVSLNNIFFSIREC